MRTGRPKPLLHLTEEEQDTLKRYVRRLKTAQHLAMRARIVLRCADGFTNTAVAEELGISKPTVGKWRSRFVERRLDGLLDEPRPGAAGLSSDRALHYTDGRPYPAAHPSYRISRHRWTCNCFWISMVCC